MRGHKKSGDIIRRVIDTWIHARFVAIGHAQRWRVGPKDEASTTSTATVRFV